MHKGKNTKQSKISHKKSSSRLNLKNSTYLHILILILVSLAVYFNSLSNGFVYDDEIFIVKNDFIKNWKNIIKSFEAKYFVYAETNRFISTLFSFVDYSIWKLNPFGYHLTNFLLHILATLVVYYFIHLLLQGSILQKQILNSSKTIAFISSLLFAIHPVHTEAVSCISFREDILVTIFFLITLILYIKAKSATHKSTKIILYLFSIISYIIALFSKEMAITLPLILVLYEVILRKNIKAKLILPYIFTTVIYIICIYFIYSKLEYQPESGSLFQRLLTLPKIILYNIKLIIIPFNLNADYIINLSSSITDTSFLIPFILLVITLIAIGHFRTHIFSSSGMSLPLIITSFSILWFFITLIPVLNIVPVFNLVAERYLYLPSIGFCMIISYLLFELINSKKLLKGYIGFSLLLIISIAYSLIVINRNKDWKDDFTLWSETVKDSPLSSRAHCNLGYALNNLGQFENAIVEFKRAIKLKPNLPEAYNNLGLSYTAIGKIDEAIEEYKKAIELRPKYAEAYNNLGIAYSSKRQFDYAIYSYQKALEIKPDFASAYSNLGIAYSNKDMYDKAIAEIQKAIGINPDYASAYSSLGNVYKKRGEIDKAIVEYKKALRLNPNLADVHCNLGNAYKSKGDFENAIYEYKCAIQIMPDFGEFHSNLGNAYSALGQWEKAIEEYNSAIKLNPNLGSAYYGLGVAYQKIGRDEDALRAFETALKLAPDDKDVIESVYKLKNK